MENFSVKRTTQKLEGREWESDANILLDELEASKNAYASFIQADIYPQKRPYFEKSYRQRSSFGTILRDEFKVVANETNARSTRPTEPIFGPIEHQVLEGSLTNEQLENLIVQKERELLLLYQALLSYDLPNVTIALLQSQAEVLNNNLQALKTDLRIKSRKHGEYTMANTIDM